MIIVDCTSIDKNSPENDSHSLKLQLKIIFLNECRIHIQYRYMYLFSSVTNRLFLIKEKYNYLKTVFCLLLFICFLWMIIAERKSLFLLFSFSYKSNKILFYRRASEKKFSHILMLFSVSKKEKNETINCDRFMITTIEFVTLKEKKAK